MKPPQDMDAEADLLASVLLSREAWEEARDVLAADGSDFYRDNHAQIWKAAQAAARAGDPVDPVSVGARLKHEPHHEALMDVTNRLGSGSVESRARRVRDLAAMRGVCARALQLVASAHAGSEDPSAWLDEAESALQAAAAGRFEGGVFVSMADVVHASVGRLVAQGDAGGGLRGTASGFADLDRVLSGFEAGRLYIVAGRPGSGKSALIEAMALGLVVADDKPGLLASLEMPLAEVGDRAIVATGRVDYEQYREARLKGEDMQRAMQAANAAANLPLHVSERPSMSLEFLSRWARRIKRRHGPLSCIALDYLQLMGGRFQRGTPREERVAENSKGLKGLAKEMGCPVIVGSQLNRQVEQRADKRPTLGDLRESGSIEQDADAVLLMHRRENTIEMNIAKNRAGRCGVVKLRWYGRFVRIDNADQRHAEPQEYDERRHWDD